MCEAVEETDGGHIPLNNANLLILLVVLLVVVVVVVVVWLSSSINCFESFR